MLQLEDAIKKIKSAGASKVFVQAPEGLKSRLQDIVSALNKAGIEAALSCEPCFGACDIRDAEARRLGCELLLHIGHSDSGLKASLPVVYVGYEIEADPAPALAKGFGAISAYQNIGLLTTAQYIGTLDKAKVFLESMGKHVLIGRGRPKHPGQILGCDQSAARSVEGDVDAFILVGTGRFHALGLVMAVEKPVFLLDLEAGCIADMEPERERLQRIRLANIEKAKECRSFGILVSTKPGQANLELAIEAKRKLSRKGRDACILAMDAIAPEKLLGLKLDCLVNCACPRLREDAAQFRKPVIGPEDVDRL